MDSSGQPMTAQVRSPATVPIPTLVAPTKQIVVGVDGSPQSLRALAYAVERARVTSEPVLAALAFQHRDFAGGGSLGAKAEGMNTTAQDTAKKSAEQLIELFVSQNPDIAIRATAVLGRPAEVLERLSDEASLIVVGTRGRNLVREAILGSVSQEVLHRAPCPVVVVR
jgi:nucleotide-binding universal stress UspA family protein